MNKPVYVFSGFLDAGKTTVIKETLSDPNFTQGERTLIIAFEEGDVTYNKSFLKANKCEVVYLDHISELTKEKMADLELEHEFDRVFIELNGLQKDEDLLRQGFLPSWEFVEELAIVDATQFMNQVNNMKTFFFDHVRYADVCIFNRADNVDKQFIRNNLKAVNPRIQIILEDSQGNTSTPADEIQFDVDANPLVISDLDYGLWYLDALDNPLKYSEKRICLHIAYVEDIPMTDEAVVMGRQAMVCCANDVQNFGITVVGINKKALKKNSFYNVTGTIRCIDDTEGYKTCLLYAEDVQAAGEPASEYVTFS
ncbi:MAG: hypothetical protein IKF18_07860 [Erysipelotrichaceae bacterium]|nr:hypothetical protein [Erysipelotrichaceae bacterium]